MAGDVVIVQVIFGTFALLFGLAIGSFLNVAISRIPDDRSVSHPPSHCPRCGSGIAWYDNIPVLSWIILRAKCRVCAMPISGLYPAIELLTGLIAWLIFRNLVAGPEDLTGATLVAFWVYLLFAACLIVATYTDLRHYIIPDQVSIYAVPFAIGGAWLAGTLGFEDLSWQQSARGALLGGGVLLVLSTLWRLVRGVEAMGMGDVKLLALIGAVLGDWPALVYVLIVSSLLGSIFGVGMMIVRRKGLRMAFPFGPFLAFAAMIFLLEGPLGMERWVDQITWLYSGGR